MKISEKIDDNRPFQGLLPRTRRRFMLRTLAIIIFIAVIYAVRDVIFFSGNNGY